MTQKSIEYHVEGPDWMHSVKIDPEIFEFDKDQYIEAASRAIELQMKVETINLGPIVIVRKGKSKKEAMVNSFICLNNISQFKVAQMLRKNFMKQSNGQDLAMDNDGFTS